MREKTKNRIKGSVSIFLVIIMVPMMCLSGLIVDGSRAELAKAAISSAGDLTMNSALANYDTVLKDVYGLFAMSQTSDDLKKNLYKYFTKTLMANGVITSEDEVQSNPLLQDIANAFSGNTSNMLSLEVDENDFHASKVTDSSLANPYILKNQIVEYEKYRAPINSALSLLDGIASLKKILNQSSVNKAKTKVDEKSGELNKNGNDLYEALKKYDDKSNSYDPTYDTFSFRGEIITHKQAYEKYIIPEYVRYLAESMPFSVKMKKSESGVYTFDFDIQHLEDTRGKDNSQWIRYTGKTTDQLLEELTYAYECFETGTIQDAASFLIHTTDVSALSLSDKQSYATAYKMYMQKVYNLKNFYDAYKGQYNADADDTTFITAHEQDISDIFENAFKFSKVLSTYESTVETARNLADDAVNALNSDLIQKIGWFSEVDTLLTNAIDAIGDVEKTVSELNSANSSLKTEIDDYNGSDAADAFSKQMQSDYKYYKESIDPAKVSALKTKLENLKTYFVNVENYLKSITFAGLTGYDDSLNTLGNLVTMTKNKNTTTGVKNVDYINAHISDGLSGLINFYKTQYSEGSKPGPQSVSIKEDEFYKYLQQAYGVKGTEEDKKSESLKDDMKNDAGKSSDATSGTNAYNIVTIDQAIMDLLPSQNKSDIPEGPNGYDGKSDNFSSLFESISNAVGDLLEGIKQAATAGRDNLYVSDYIFDMFTYNTMNAECEFEKNKLQGSTEDEINKELKKYLETSSGVKKNEKNNFMYGAEIEYILYGSMDASKNIKSAKQTIFCIRFLANSGYALTNAEIKSITLPPALAVQAATCGIVPYKLTQVVLQLCLSLAESANDLRLMSNGEKVALIKSGDTWVMSPKGALNEAAKIAKEVAAGVIQEGATKLNGVVNELIDKGTEKVKISADHFISDMTVAVNEEVQKLVGSAFSSFEDGLVSSLDSCLKAGRDVAGSAAEVADEIINNADAKAREAINGCSNKVRPIVERMYNAYIGDKLSEFKKEIQDELSKIKDTNAGQILLDVQNKMSTKIKDLIKDLGNSVSKQTSSLIDDLKNKVGAKAGGYIEMGADKILDATNGFIDETFNSLSDKMPDIAGKASNSATLATVLKFNYGNYLQIFVFLKLCVNDTDVLTRTADIIQLNINQGLADSKYVHPKKGEFLMTDAYTYVQIDAKIKLKTMFISLPFFTEYADDGASYFKLNYKSVLGY